jgi:hypothetical protein
VTLAMSLLGEVAAVGDLSFVMHVASQCVQLRVIGGAVSERQDEPSSCASGFPRVRRADRRRADVDANSERITSSSGGTTSRTGSGPSPPRGVDGLADTARLHERVVPALQAVNP